MAISNITLGPVPEDYVQPRTVYRLFGEAAHADAFVRGDIWISTLERCRRYDDALQGDPLEATLAYLSGPPIQVDAPGGHEVARRSGIHLHNASGGTLSHNTCTTRMPDAFVICTTSTLDVPNLAKTFGRFAVEIQKPRAFFSRVTAAIEAEFRLQCRAMGPVEYVNPVTVGLGEELPLGFIKRPAYAHQREFRFMWQPVQSSLPIQLRPFHVPSAVSLCRRLPDLT